jgi:hypothetical protein
MSLPEYPALRVLSAIRRGSSWPVVVQTPGGTFVTKLRGAAQGVAPLVAEIIVAELATALGLPVPERALVRLDETTPTDDANDELADLLARSHGTNLGFRFLPGATDLRDDQLHLIDEELASRIVWLDALVMNPDRTARNGNILLWHRQPWLIDHGAALGFHYDFGGLTEQAPRDRTFDLDGHLLRRRATRLRDVDDGLAKALTRGVLEAAVAVVPTGFLETAFPRESPARVRAAYAAFLWKRLKAPRPFLAE